MDMNPCWGKGVPALLWAQNCIEWSMESPHGPPK